MRGPVEVRRPPFCIHGVRAAGVRIGSVGLDRASPVDCVVNCTPSVCQRAQPWSNCHRVYAPQGAPSVRTGCACRKAAGRRAGTHLQGRRMLSRHMHSVAKRPALFQINAFACYLTGALRPPVRMPFQPAHPLQPAPPALAPTGRPARFLCPAGRPARFACYAALPLRLVDHVVAGDLVDGPVGQVERDEAV